MDFLKNIKSNIPNAITLLNLLAGCLSVVSAFNDELEIAAYLIGIAAVLDFCDGFFARLLKAYSDIGKQLDSFADLISFGLAPSAIIFAMMNRGFAPDGDFESFRWYNYAILYSPFLITLFSAIRLAIFNIDTRQSESFIGLPTPANALFFASFPLIFGFNCSIYGCIATNPYFLAGLIVFHSMLMVSNIPLFSLKFKNFDFKENKIRFLFIFFSIVLMFVLRYKSIPVMVYLYLFLSSLIKPKTETN